MVLLRGAAITGIAAWMTYLSWRLWAGPTMAPLSWGLFGAEVLLCVLYCLDVWASWPEQPTNHKAYSHPSTAAVLIVVYDEPEVAVRAALGACTRLHQVDVVYLLDAIGNEALRTLSTRFGATYLRPHSNEGGRSGATADGLEQVAADVVLLMSGDQVPRPDVVERGLQLLGEDVAVVQIRHEFLNIDSAIHHSRTRHEESWQNDVVMPAAESRGAAMWLTPGAVLRRTALDDIGGYPVDRGASELLATARLQAAGWKIRYLNEALLMGLAPRNLQAFITQRAGWARGQLRLLGCPSSPLRASTRTAAQRLHQVQLTLSHLGALAYTTIGGVLLAALLLGVCPLPVSPIGLGLLTATIATTATGRVAISRKTLPPGATLNRNLLLVESRLRALVHNIGPDPSRDESATGAGRHPEAMRHLPLLYLFVTVLEIAVSLRVLDAVIGWPLPTAHGAELAVIVMWGGSTAWFGLRVLGGFVGRRQDRTHHRARVDFLGSVNGTAAWVVDLSAEGAGVVTTLHPEVGTHLDLTVHLRVRTIHVRAVVRSVLANQDASRHRLGLQLVAMDESVLDDILSETTLPVVDEPVRS